MGAQYFNKALGYDEVLRNWVFRLLTSVNKHTSWLTSNECLAIFERIVIIFGVYHSSWWNQDSSKYTEDQVTFHKRVFRDKSTPKKATLPSNKVMVTVFRNVCGLIHVDYLDILTYWTVSTILQTKIRPHFTKNIINFRQGNARSRLRFTFASTVIAGLSTQLLFLFSLLLKRTLIWGWSNSVF